VSEEELVRAAAASADVGLVPYPKTNNLYANCSPNKLSQYMAASLPILANDTNFVRDVVNEADCGIVVNFGNLQALVEAVNTLGADEALRKRFSINGMNHFRKAFNWQNMATAFYRHLVNLAAHKPCVLTYVANPTEPYYIQKSALDLPVGTTNVVQWTVAEVRGKKTFMSKCRVLLRPIWQRLPCSFKDRLRQLFLKTS
jgi:hypothetical protein